MKDIKINDGSIRRCFVLKEGPAATIAIPLRKLMAVDFRRLKTIEAQGGEMLKTMRDWKLDNGRNALKQYEPLIEVIHNPQFKRDKIRREQEEAKEQTVSSEVATESTETQEVAPKKKRGPGRPPKQPKEE